MKTIPHPRETHSHSRIVSLTSDVIINGLIISSRNLGAAIRESGFAVREGVPAGDESLTQAREPRYEAMKAMTISLLERGLVSRRRRCVTLLTSAASGGPLGEEERPIPFIASMFPATTKGGGAKIIDPRHNLARIERVQIPIDSGMIVSLLSDDHCVSKAATGRFPLHQGVSSCTLLIVR
jgi:hypothetical protein